MRLHLTRLPLRYSMRQHTILHGSGTEDDQKELDIQRSDLPFLGIGGRHRVWVVRDQTSPSEGVSVHGSKPIMVFIFPISSAKFVPINFHAKTRIRGEVREREEEEKEGHTH